MIFNPKERGQSVAVFAVIILFIAVFGYLAITTMGSKGYQDGADVIGETVGEAIEGVTSEPSDADVESFIASADSAVKFWLNSQKLTPNTHSVERHGADAWAATNCYNNNGFFQWWRMGNDEFHGLCKEKDGSIYDVIFKRRSNTSREFDLRTCFKPDRQILKNLTNWFKNTKGGQSVSPPNDILIYVDDVIVP